MLQQLLGDASEKFSRQLLLCRVALGKSFFQFSAMKMAHAPPGHHSVVGRPSVGGLSFPEYVIYRGEQVQIMLQIFVTNLKSTFLGLSRIFSNVFDSQARI